MNESPEWVTCELTLLVQSTVPSRSVCLQNTGKDDQLHWGLSQSVSARASDPTAKNRESRTSGWTKGTGGWLGAKCYSPDHRANLGCCWWGNVWFNRWFCANTPNGLCLCCRFWTTRSWLRSDWIPGSWSRSNYGPVNNDMVKRVQHWWKNKLQTLHAKHEAAGRY